MQSSQALGSTWWWRSATRLLDTLEINRLGSTPLLGFILNFSARAWSVLLLSCLGEPNLVVNIIFDIIISKIISKVDVWCFALRVDAGGESC